MTFTSRRTGTASAQAAGDSGFTIDSTVAVSATEAPRLNKHDTPVLNRIR